MDDKAYVYWIRLPHHKDPYKQGYIGFTSTSVEERFKRHVKSAKYGSEYIIHKAIRKYGEDSLVVDVIFEGTIEDAYEEEKKYRPTIWVGWNICAGGQGGNAPFIKSLWEDPEMRKHLEECGRKRMTAQWECEEYQKEMSKMTTDTWKDSETRKKRVDGISKGSFKRYERDGPWANPRTLRDTWKDAVNLMNAWEENGKPGCHVLSKITGYKVSSLQNIVKYFKSGWNPLEDERWKKEFYNE